MKSLLVALAVLCYADFADSQARGGYAFGEVYASRGRESYNQDGRSAAEEHNPQTMNNFGTGGIQNSRLAAGSRSANLLSNTGVNSNVNSPQGMMDVNLPGRMTTDFRRQLYDGSSWGTQSGRDTGYGIAEQTKVAGSWNRGTADRGNLFTGESANFEPVRELNNRWNPRLGNLGNFGVGIDDLNKNSGKLNDGLVKEITDLITGFIQNENTSGLLRSGSFTDGNKDKNGFAANGDASRSDRIPGYDAKDSFSNRNFAGSYSNGPLRLGVRTSLPSGQTAIRPENTLASSRSSDGTSNIRNGMVVNGDASDAPSAVEYDSGRGLPNINFGGNVWNGPFGTDVNVPLAGAQTAVISGDAPIVERPIIGASNARDLSIVGKDISGVNIPNGVQEYDSGSGLAYRNFGGNVWNGLFGAGGETAVGQGKGDISAADRPINGVSNVKDGPVVNGDISSMAFSGETQGYDSRSGLPNSNLKRNIWYGRRRIGANLPSADHLTADGSGDILVGGESLNNAGQGNSRTVGEPNMFPGRFWKGNDNRGDALVGNSVPLKGTSDDGDTGGAFLEKGPMNNGGTGGVGGGLTSLQSTEGKLGVLGSSPNINVEGSKIPSNIMNSPFPTKGKTIVSLDRTVSNASPTKISEPTKPVTSYGSPGADVRDINGLLQTDFLSDNGSKDVIGPANLSQLSDAGKPSFSGTSVFESGNEGNMSGNTCSQDCSDEIPKRQKKKSKKGKCRTLKKSKNVSSKKREDSHGITNAPFDLDEWKSANSAIYNENFNPGTESDDIFSTDDDADFLKILQENGKAANSSEIQDLVHK